MRERKCRNADGGNIKGAIEDLDKGGQKMRGEKREKSKSHKSELF